MAAPSDASPVRGGVTTGDGGVRRLAGRVPFRAAAHRWDTPVVYAAMHPSVCGLRRIHLPLQGRLWVAAPSDASPVRGGVTTGDGGVRHLAGPLPLQVVCTLPPHP